MEKGLPAKFSKTEGVKWSVALPGLSASVPVVWGNKVFITAPIEASKQLVALCYDATTGKELWRNVVSEGNDLQWDNKSNVASPSPTTTRSPASSTSTTPAATVTSGSTSTAGAARIPTSPASRAAAPS